MLLLSPNARLNPTKAAVSSKLEKSLLEGFSDISPESSLILFFLSNKFKKVIETSRIIKTKKTIAYPTNETYRPSPII